MTASSTMIWDYCSIRSVHRGFWRRSQLLMEDWSPDGNLRSTVKCDNLYSQIGRLGADGWELVSHIEAQEVLRGDVEPCMNRCSLLRRPKTEDTTMPKWEYCRIHWLCIAEGLISNRFKLVIEYWHPTGVNPTEDSLMPDVHSTAAKLAQEGWEVVTWIPPSMNPKEALQSGAILMKRASGAF